MVGKWVVPMGKVRADMSVDYSVAKKASVKVDL